METLYFTTTYITKEYLSSTPYEDNGFDYDKYDDYIELGDENYSDAGVVNIQLLIDELEKLKEKGVRRTT